MTGVLKDQIDRLVQQKRPQHAAQGGEKIGNFEFNGPGFEFARFHFGQIQQIVDEFEQILRGFADVIDLLLLFSGERSIGAVAQQASERKNRIERRAELVAHVGEELRLQLVGAPEVVGLFVQFGVKRHDTAVRVFQFTIDAGQFQLPGANFLQRPEQLLVLKLQLLNGILRTLAGETDRDAGQLRFGDQRGAFGNQLGQHDRGSGAWGRIDLEPVHQPFRADNAEPHTGLRLVAAFEDSGQVGDTRAAIDDFHHEQLGLGAAFHQKLDPAAVRVVERVAGNLGNSGRDARLILRVESQQPGDLTRALTRVDRIVLLTNLSGKDRKAHCTYAALATSTVASSRPREKSR